MRNLILKFALTLLNSSVDVSHRIPRHSLRVPMRMQTVPLYLELDMKIFQFLDTTVRETLMSRISNPFVSCVVKSSATEEACLEVGLIIWTCIREELGSSFGRVTGCSDCFTWFRQSVQANSRTTPRLDNDCFLPNIFISSSINYSTPSYTSDIESIVKYPTKHTAYEPQGFDFTVHRFVLPSIDKCWKNIEISFSYFEMQQEVASRWHISTLIFGSLHSRDMYRLHNASEERL
jgi:hypothetical protein